ncbi:MAG: hypothetical protein PHP92_04925 [Candidatus Nanoarchaeia archaeon]|nr:hypothetical protein [Candidatus Nanoarchaeia archaeon]
MSKEKFEYKVSCPVCGDVGLFVVYKKFTKENKDKAGCPICHKRILTIHSGDKITLTDKGHLISKEKINDNEIDALREKVK